MKNKKIFALTSALMAIGMIATLPSPAINETDKMVDNAVYETPVVAKLDRPDVVAEGEGEVPAPIDYGVKTVEMHYHNDDGLCGKRNFYIWVTNEKAIELPPTEVSVDGQDMHIVIDLENDYPQFAGKENLLFIVKFVGTWNGQSEDLVLDYSVHSPDKDGKVTIWCVPGEGNAVDIFKTEAETKFDKVLTAKFVSFKGIECVATAEPIEYKLYAFDTTYLRGDSNTQYRDKPTRLYKSGKPEGKMVDGKYVFYINFNYIAKINVKYVIETTYASKPDKVQAKAVTTENFYLTERFNKFYNYSGNDLGAVYTPEKTTFKLWAPTAGHVRLYVYNTGTPTKLGGNNIGKGYNMYFRPGGVWEVTVEGNLAGKYYTYQVQNSNGLNEVCDPYAKSTGINGLRGYICDWNSTDPENWDSVPEVWDGVEGYDINEPQDLSIYEVHIRDLTMDETWTGNSKRGTYSAFFESGTTYTKELNGEPVTVKTGFDHIKELGVKAIQILPFFDQDNDETDMTFNWGYNPLNYNVVEGGYATDPYDGAARVTEFKELVKAYANNGNHTRVIMDVVYNHVSSAAKSNLTKIMPKYYFRYDKDWNYTNGSGVSNEVRTEAPMMSKFIVDSLCWWASEYKIKGFRFDLMGLIDTVTMRKVKDELYKIDKDIIVYGEGWDGFGGYNGNEGTHGTYTDNVFTELYSTTESPGKIAAFNDAGRNKIRGGNDRGFGTNVPYPGWGYISQGDDVGNGASGVAAMIRGTYSWDGDKVNAKTTNPNQVVNYASCHDNYTLFDQISYTLVDYGEGVTPMEPKLEQMPSLELLTSAVAASQAAVMFSNGIAFMQGGEEFFRSKEVAEVDVESSRPYPDYPAWIDPDDPKMKGKQIATGEVRMFGKLISHNSYNLSDETNSFKWDRKISITENGVTFDTTKYNEVFIKMVEYHNTSTKYAINDNLLDSNIQTFGAIDGSSAFGMRLGDTYIFFGGRLGGKVNVGGLLDKTEVINTAINKDIVMDADSITVPAGTFVAYR